MTPAKSVLVVASLASALMPPRIARALVLVVFALTTGFALWFATADRFAGGIVAEVFPAGDAPRLITAVTPLDARAIHLPAGITPAPQTGDMVLASGALDQAHSGSFLAADTVTVLPLAAWRAELASRGATIPFDDVHPAGLILAAAILVMFAPAVLRLAFAAGMAGTTAVTTIALWHLNKGMVVLPLPPDSVEPVLFGAALLGLVAGWKAMGIKEGGAVRAFGLRAAALLLAAPASLALEPLLGSSPTLLLIPLLVAAILRPALLPASLAVPLLDRALGLSAQSLLAAAIAIVVLRLWLDRQPISAASQPARATAPPFTPRPDPRGAFDLTQILDPQKEN